MQGIYVIRCIFEDKVYIGSSVDINRRWTEHRSKLNTQKHANKQLQEDWDCYGDESFIFEVIEETTELIKAEQRYLNSLWPNCYNSSQNAWNPQRNSETIQKGKQTTFDRYGTRSTGGKFIESQVLDIIARLNAGELATDIAKDYNVHYSSIYYIKQGKNWPQLKHLISLPKKPREIAFDYFDQGYDRFEIYKLLKKKHDRSVIWAWEKAYLKQRLSK